MQHKVITVEYIQIILFSTQLEEKLVLAHKKRLTLISGGRIFFPINIKVGLGLFQVLHFGHTVYLRLSPG